MAPLDFFARHTSTPYSSGSSSQRLYGKGLVPRMGGVRLVVAEKAVGGVDVRSRRPANALPSSYVQNTRSSCSE